MAVSDALPLEAARPASPCVMNAYLLIYQSPYLSAPAHQFNTLSQRKDVTDFPACFPGTSMSHISFSAMKTELYNRYREIIGQSSATERFISPMC